MKYKITTYIDRPYNDYEHLAHGFKNNDIYLGLTYDKLDQHYGVVFSAHIETLDSVEKIAKRLFSLQILLTGARFINLTHETHRRIEFDKFEIEEHDFLPNGVHNVYADTIEEYPFDGTEEENIKNPNLHIACTLDSMLFSLSKIDYIIRDLLFQAGMIRTYQSFEKISTWNILYKIVDTVKYGCEKISIDIKDLIESGDLERFTSACNNTLVLGINARHGLKFKDKPKKEPIVDINEAVNLILCLAKKFVIQYINNKKYCNVTEFSKEKCVYEEVLNNGHSDMDYSLLEDL